MSDCGRFEGGKRCHSGGGGRKPFFSIITVAYNNASHLSRSLDSVLSQSFDDFEIIIVDGGSSDGTRELLKSRASEIDYFVSEPDLGIYNALNKGIGYAAGQIIGIIHSDDMLSYGSLARYHKVFSEADCDLVLGDCCYFDKSLRLTAYKPARNYGIETLFRGITAAHEAIFIRAKAYKRYGCYDERYRSAADFKLITSMVMSGAKVGLTRSIEVYKLDGGTSFAPDIEFSENYRVVREYIPSLSEDDYQVLLNIKNYKSCGPQVLRRAYGILRGLEASSLVLRSLGLSFLAMLLGDNSNSSFSRVGEKPKYESDSYLDSRYLLCVHAIKGVSGGAERVLLDLASHLHNEGNEVLVACSDGKAGSPFYKVDSDFDIVDIHEPPHREQLHKGYDIAHELVEIIGRIPDEIVLAAMCCYESRSRFTNWDGFIRECRSTNVREMSKLRAVLLEEVGEWVRRYGDRVIKWRNLIVAFKPTVVVPFMVSSTTIVYVAARKTRSKIVLSNHGNPVRDYLYQDDWDSGFLDRALRYFAICAAHGCQWLDEEFLDYIPNAARKKSRVIPNPVATKGMKEIECRKKVVLGVGRLIRIKRFDLLIRAFDDALKYVDGWKLNIYGDGPLHNELNKLIVELGRERDISLCGRSNKIFDVYAGSSFQVSCSEMEGFGLTVAEGLISGLPAIVNGSTSGLRRLIEDERNGLVVNGATDEELVLQFSKAIVRYASRPDELSAASNVARASMSRFSADIVHSRWSNYLREIVQQ